MDVIKNKAVWLFLILLFLVGLFKNYKLYDHYAYDLRNRVVGSRMIHDGVSPYFYIWTPKDNLRYFDIDHYSIVSSVTITPFAAQLMYPLAELKQMAIIKWWFIIEHLCFIASVLIAFLLCESSIKRKYILLFSGMLLFTDAWTVHLFTGQYYIFIVFLFMVFLYLQSFNQNKFATLLAGAIAIITILIRPTASILFIPTLLNREKYNLRWLILGATGAAIMASLTLFQTNTTGVWKDYLLAVKIHTDLHEKGMSNFLSSWKHLPVDSIEGINYKDIADNKISAITIFPEYSNLPYLTKLAFHKKIPTGFFLFFFFCITISCYWLLIKKKKKQELYQLYIIVACLFILSDFFSPITRHQYYTVLWLIPVLTACLNYKKDQKKLFFLIFAGLFFNITHFSFLKMEHTIGEMFLLTALIIIGLKPYSPERIELPL